MRSVYAIFGLSAVFIAAAVIFRPLWFRGALVANDGNVSSSTAVSFVTPNATSSNEQIKLSDSGTKKVQDQKKVQGESSESAQSAPTKASTTPSASLGETAKAAAITDAKPVVATTAQFAFDQSWREAIVNPLCLDGSSGAALLSTNEGSF